MKIIFLDINGVMNSQQFYEKRCKPFKSKSHLQYKINEIDPVALKYLNMIIEKTGAKIVISSCWRLNMKYTKKALYANGLIEKSIIGSTDYLYEAVFNEKGKYQHSCRQPYIYRGNEVYKWLHDHKPDDVYSFRDMNYVIIDDDSDFFIWQQERFVHTKNEKGLTKRDAKKAIKILNRKDK